MLKDMEHLQYPIGRFSPKPDYSAEEVEGMIRQLDQIPAAYASTVTSLPEADLGKTYRPGSWTVQQLVHHVADIHLLYYLRMKKTLTETDPVAVMTQVEDCAALPDAMWAPVASSLLMLEGTNQRLVFFLSSLNEAAWNKTHYHPTRQMHLSIKQTLYMALWHGLHHLGHIQLALGHQP